MLFSSCSSEEITTTDVDIVDIEETEEEKSYTNTIKDSLVIAHWNIGHFSNGVSNSTRITEGQYSQKQIESVGLLESVNPDIFGVCEYDDIFSLDGSKSIDAIFYMFNNSAIGPKLSYNCNTIFSKDLPLYNQILKDFKQRRQARYFNAVDIMVNSKVIKFVETHLDWNEAGVGESCRKSQIEELISFFSKYDYVIICGDFNVANKTEYTPFDNAGYKKANCGEFGDFLTANSARPTLPIDNILAKGLEILKVECFTEPKLSDHCLLRCVVDVK